MDADLWVSENVKIGWIGEVLRLPLAEALVPIVSRALEDGAAAERARIRGDLLAWVEAHNWREDGIGKPVVPHRGLLDALDKICPAEE
jgi:hypothetical protein